MQLLHIHLCKLYTIYIVETNKHFFQGKQKFMKTYGELKIKYQTYKKLQNITPKAKKYQKTIELDSVNQIHIQNII